MSNLMDHAKIELEMAGYFKKDGMYGDMIGVAVMELMKVFSDQGHSGMSASIVSSLFNTVSMFKPICPITGKDEEWSDVGNGLFQNKRCSAIFKQADGICTYNNAITWKTQKDITWSGSAKDKNGEIVRSSQPIKFPFLPKIFIVDVIETDQDFIINNEKQLIEVFAYYRKDK